MWASVALRGAFAAAARGVRLLPALVLAGLLAACGRPEPRPDMPFSSAYGQRTGWMVTTASARLSRGDEDAIIARAITEHERRHP